jgi:hypothetical protein
MFSASATPLSNITPTNNVPQRRTTRRSMSNTPFTNSGAAKTRYVPAPVSYQENSTPSRRDDTSLNERLFVHLVVIGEGPNACR